MIARFTKCFFPLLQCNYSCNKNIAEHSVACKNWVRNKVSISYMPFRSLFSFLCHWRGKDQKSLLLHQIINNRFFPSCQLTWQELVFLFQKAARGSLPTASAHSVFPELCSLKWGCPHIPPVGSCSLIPFFPSFYVSSCPLIRCCQWAGSSVSAMLSTCTPQHWRQQGQLN